MTMKTDLSEFYLSLGRSLVETAAQLGFDTGAAVAGSSGYLDSTLERCRDSLAGKTTRFSLLPFGASQTSGSGPLVPVWYLMVVLDDKSLSPNPLGTDFNALCDAIMDVSHGFESGEYVAFLSKYLVLYNDMTIETSSRRIKITVREAENTAMFALWLMRKSQLDATQPVLMSQSPSGGASAKSGPIPQSFADQWSFE